MVIKTLVVNTIQDGPTREAVTQEGGLVRATTSDAATDEAWRTYFYLLEQENLKGIHDSLEAHTRADRGSGEIPSGMEGHYYY